MTKPDFAQKNKEMEEYCQSKYGRSFRESYASDFRNTLPQEERDFIMKHVACQFDEICYDTYGVSSNDPNIRPIMKAELNRNFKDIVKSFQCGVFSEFKYLLKYYYTYCLYVSLFMVGLNFFFDTNISLFVIMLPYMFTTLIFVLATIWNLIIICIAGIITFFR